jgi:arylsulfatase A-like enzyme
MNSPNFALNFCLSFAICLAVLNTTMFGQETKDEIKRPNIIFLMADDQNVMSVGCYGNDEVQTPHMDRLAREGIAFDRHYNTTAICMACRATVMTGMYEYRTGTNFAHGNMRKETWQKSYPVLLREAGYYSAFAGKFGFLVKDKGLCEDDFDQWGGSPGQTEFATSKNKSMAAYAKEYPHSTLSYGAFGQDAIRAANAAGQPLLLSISFKAPHRPVTPDPKFKHIYEGKTFTKPANYGREAGKHLSEQSKQGRQYPRFEEWDYDKDYDKVMAKYYQQVYAIDVAVGMIRDELETQGMADNTVIIYTSDNGFICGAHGYGSKVLPMEESARVPLMILDPRSSTAGKQMRSSSLTGNIDFAPTILELAGLPVPDHMDGSSLLPLLEDPESDVRQQMAFINVFPPLPTSCLTVLTKELKYTYWWFSNEKMKPTEELFDLVQDPLEMTNLAIDDEGSEKLEAMRKKYDTEVTAWKEKAVPYNDYQRFGVFFDRNISEAEKKNRQPKRGKDKKDAKKEVAN